VTTLLVSVSVVHDMGVNTGCLTKNQERQKSTYDQIAQSCFNCCKQNIHQSIHIGVCVLSLIHCLVRRIAAQDIGPSMMAQIKMDIFTFGR
jgi:hypothetical protein